MREPRGQGWWRAGGGGKPGSGEAGRRACGAPGARPCRADLPRPRAGEDALRNRQGSPESSLGGKHLGLAELEKPENLQARPWSRSRPCRAKP